MPRHLPFLFMFFSIMVRILYALDHPVEFQNSRIIFPIQEEVIDLSISFRMNISAIHGNCAAQNGFLRSNADPVSVSGHQQRHAQTFPAEADITRFASHPLQIFGEDTLCGKFFLFCPVKIFPGSYFLTRLDLAGQPGGLGKELPAVCREKADGSASSIYLDLDLPGGEFRQ